MSDDTPITGIDVPAVTAWFTEHTDAAPPLAFELIAGGRSNLFANLYIADGAAFPSLPSKSITMSLAAHATRVARSAEL